MLQITVKYFSLTCNNFHVTNFFLTIFLLQFSCSFLVTNISVLYLLCNRVFQTIVNADDAIVLLNLVSQIFTITAINISHFSIKNIIYTCQVLFYGVISAISCSMGRISEKNSYQHFFCHQSKMIILV